MTMSTHYPSSVKCQRSVLLHQLSESFAYYHDRPLPIYGYGDTSIDSSAMATQYHAGRNFKEISDHIAFCPYFNGLMLSADVRRLSRQDSHPDPITIRCCCGFESYFPGQLWTAKFMGRSIEEIVMEVNHEFFPYTREGIEKKVIRKFEERRQISKLEIKDKLEGAKKSVTSPLKCIEV